MKDIGIVEQVCGFMANQIDFKLKTYLDFGNKLIK